MLLLATSHTETVLLAARGGAGKAAVWIVGWLVLIALVVAGVVYLSRRRGSRSGDQ